jgi:hypothetical protein
VISDEFNTLVLKVTFCLQLIVLGSPGQAKPDSLVTLLLAVCPCPSLKEPHQEVFSSTPCSESTSYQPIHALLLLLRRFLWCLLSNNVPSLVKSTLSVLSSTRVSGVRRHLGTASTSMGGLSSSVNADEIAHFSRLSSLWWDEAGEFGMLHKMNPVRVQFIREKLLEVARDEETELKAAKIEASGHPLKGLDVLDVGCGGGLLSEVRDTSSYYDLGITIRISILLDSCAYGCSNNWN